MSENSPEFWFVAVERFEPDYTERWVNYVEFARLPQCTEVVSLDNMLCPSIINELNEEDWQHNIHEHFRTKFFRNLDYLCQRVKGYPNVNILSVVFEPQCDMKHSLADNRFTFYGYDLIEEGSGISAINNCGGFEKAFTNAEVSSYGLIENYERAKEIQQQLLVHYPDEIHAYCDLWAIWRLA